MTIDIIKKYLEWYYIDKVSQIFRGWRDYLFIYFNYFSIPTLIKTFFSPWKRVSSSYGRGFDLKVFFETLVFNMMSRIIGMIIRMFFLVFAIIFEIIIIILGLLIIIIWLFFPLIFITGIIYGLLIIFS